jgi:adenosylmethionine-8-amino-7-oxononanoate aminotransferase
VRANVPVSSDTLNARNVETKQSLRIVDVLENDALIAQSASRGTHLHRRLHEAFDDHPLVGPPAARPANEINVYETDRQPAHIRRNSCD